MNCPTCGDKPKKMAQSFTKAVIEIDNPEQIALLRKVVIPASMGDDESIPAAIGKYRNVILHYEANQHTYIYSSDGIPTFLEMSIPEEVMNRIATLETSMSKEILDRENADTVLQNNINAEALTRKNADDALGGRLTTVEGIAATALQPAAIDKVVMTDISLNANSSTTTVQIDGAKENLLTGAQTTKNIPLPVASHDEAGVMNSSTFDAVTNNTSNINALMNGAVAITGLSASPSQSDLTTAWQTETGLTALMNRAGIYDVTNNKVWTYYTNDSTWYAATNTSQVTINTFTNSAEGTIKGSTNVGQVFAENDGTGSVNGWDSLSGNVSTNTNDISSLQTTVAGKQDKLTAGQNITITGNVISATGNSYTAGNAIHIDSTDNNRIDADIYPADFFTAGETLTGTGSNITLNETIPAKLKDVELYGDSSQNGTPTPDAPVDVNVVTGEQTVKVTGKNLIDANGNFSYGSTVNRTTSNGDGTITTTSKIGMARSAGQRIIGLKPNTKYTLSATCMSYSGDVTSGNGAEMELLDSSSGSAVGLAHVYFGQVTALPGDGEITVTTPEDTSNIWVSFNGNTTYPSSSAPFPTVVIGNLQLEEGETPTDYVPYQSQSYTVNLGSTELCKIGNYQDYIYKSGDDWYVHKEIGKVVLNGSEDWGTHNTYNNITGYAWRTAGAAHSDSAILADKYRAVAVSVYNSDSRAYGMIATLEKASTSANTTIFMSAPNNTVTSLAAFETWLSSNNVTAYYALATATNTKITDNNLIGQLNALASANAYLDTTHFLTTATGTNLPVILDIVAYKKSLDGVINSIPNAQVQSNWTQADTTAPDYIKNKPSIPAAQIQSDWDQADNSAVDYIKNKPTIPTVNDATLTIQQNGVDVTTFTANASSNATANITSPVITMTTTDPGEGSVLADNNYIGVYGGDPIIMDYSITEVNTGAKWINGSAIYKKTVNTGALPNATTKNVAHNIGSLSRVLKMDGYAYNTTSGVSQFLPMVAAAIDDQVRVVVDSTNISLACTHDRSSYDESYVTLYYTKSS